MAAAGNASSSHNPRRTRSTGCITPRIVMCG
jgi:hypothetical protein